MRINSTNDIHGKYRSIKNETDGYFTYGICVGAWMELQEEKDIEEDTKILCRRIGELISHRITRDELIIKTAPQIGGSLETMSTIGLSVYVFTAKELEEYKSAVIKEYRQSIGLE